MVEFRIFVPSNVVPSINAFVEIMSKTMRNDILKNTFLELAHEAAEKDDRVDCYFISKSSHDLGLKLRNGEALERKTLNVAFRTEKPSLISFAYGYNKEELFELKTISDVVTAMDKHLFSHTCVDVKKTISKKSINAQLLFPEFDPEKNGKASKSNYNFVVELTELRVDPDNKLNVIPEEYRTYYSVSLESKGIKDKFFGENLNSLVNFSPVYKQMSSNLLHHDLSIAENPSVDVKNVSFSSSSPFLEIFDHHGIESFDISQLLASSYVKEENDSSNLSSTMIAFPDMNKKMILLGGYPDLLALVQRFLEHSQAQEKHERETSEAERF
eukprot:GDKK01034744.1.p1 GENE.GDKK01034744.1~~GDKK01034744.1.p1  ORF type:complete len:341 (+),score=69.29 GDKK01034744.1:40-1023(+)